MKAKIFPHMKYEPLIKRKNEEVEKKTGRLRRLMSFQNAVLCFLNAIKIRKRRKTTQNIQRSYICRFQLHSSQTYHFTLQVCEKFLFSTDDLRVSNIIYHWTMRPLISISPIIFIISFLTCPNETQETSKTPKPNANHATKLNRNE